MVKDFVRPGGTHGECVELLLAVDEWVKSHPHPHYQSFTAAHLPIVPHLIPAPTSAMEDIFDPYDSSSNLKQSSSSKASYTSFSLKPTLSHQTPSISPSYSSSSSPSSTSSPSKLLDSQDLGVGGTRIKRLRRTSSGVFYQKAALDPLGDHTSKNCNSITDGEEPSDIQSRHISFLFFIFILEN
jgi:hypothetical protein